MLCRTLTTAATLALLAMPAFAQDTVVVTSDELLPALDDWREHRAAQGHEIRAITGAPDTRTAIRAAHERSEGKLRHVLILGDVAHVPCEYRPVNVIAPWERDDKIATDEPYADVDDDGLPDLAIGRLPADDVDHARALLARSIAYEKHGDTSTWRRRLEVIAGVGGFGRQEDMALEMVTRLFMNRDIPPAIDLQFTYAKPTSPFCPPPDALQDTVVDRLNSSPLVAAYVGHGSKNRLDRMTWGEAELPILDATGVEKIEMSPSGPIVVFVACSTGSFDGDKDCLAEDVMRRDRGPPAIIASSRVSTPYGNAIFSKGLLDTLYLGDAETLGEAVREAKLKLLDDDSTDLARKQFDAFARAFYSTDPKHLAADRREHALLYHLFGDPLLRLARPRSAELHPPSQVRAGETLKVAVQTPIGGRVTVELLPRRDSNARTRTGRTESDEFREVYATANVSPLLMGEKHADEPGLVVIEIPVPADLKPTRYLLRAYVEGESDGAMAGGTIRVDPTR